MIASYTELPEGLPAPEDDGAARHLPGLAMPPLPLASTAGGTVDLASVKGRMVAYVYPMTGRPGVALPDGWDEIPGARGCTPESCGFRDHHGELQDLGADVCGVSTQTTGYQREVAARLHLPFALLSDADHLLGDTLSLPSFEAAGARLWKRLTLVICDGVIEHVFYPVFPPDAHADEVLGWLRAHAR